MTDPSQATHSTTQIHDGITANAQSTETAKVAVWDWLVRLTHWGVAIAVFMNLFVTEEGSEIHEWVGYAMVGMVVVRLLWGLVGTKYARFSHFFPTPARIKHHLGEVKVRQHRHAGHNPLGALMMFALWGALLGIGLSGYLMTTDAFWGVEWVEEVHEALAESLYVLIPLHVISAIAMSWWQRSNLVRAMVTGKQTVHHPLD